MPTYDERLQNRRALLRSTRRQLRYQAIVVVRDTTPSEPTFGAYGPFASELDAEEWTAAFLWKWRKSAGLTAHVMELRPPAWGRSATLFLFGLHQDGALREHGRIDAELAREARSFPNGSRHLRSPVG